MKIELKEIKIKDLVKGYVNNEEEGVIGYNGLLNIRPKYQREFVYKDKQRDEVINTVRKNFPLNVMYWCKNDIDNFELLDGQQRTISICEYIEGNFSINGLAFHNLTKDQQEQILNYKLMIYFCEGTDSEKLNWFKIINIATVELTPQELRNAIYTGEWLTDAKRYFSKNGCPAYKIANKYLNVSYIRQEYLETALKWICNRDNIKEIKDYMSKNQNNNNANELWLYFQDVINWVNATFTVYRKEMKGLEWGYLYNKYKDKNLNPKELEKQISNLMKDEFDEITNKRGIYEYLLSGNEKYLSIRSFKDNEKRKVYERQGGICVKCRNYFDIEEMEADHITPYSEGGHTIIDNCQLLCKHCNRVKSNK